MHRLAIVVAIASLVLGGCKGSSVEQSTTDQSSSVEARVSDQTEMEGLTIQAAAERHLRVCPGLTGVRGEMTQTRLGERIRVVADGGYEETFGFLQTQRGYTLAQPPTCPAGAK